jgi:AraC family transcriptional regulator
LLVMFKQYTIAKTNHCESCKFLTKPIEKDKIIKARDILISRLNQPPTIQTLSLEVGINQCYLKKGFKELFGYTIYDFLVNERMIHAKLLLQTRDLSISEVAQQIGYANTSSFSSAFKKNTGFFPSEIKP